RVAVGLAPREDALVVARARCFAELALGLHLNSRSIRLAEPWLGLQRALARPELQHLPRTAHRLAHRPAAVQLLACHFGTSSKPPSMSRISQPSASIAARRRSAFS